MDYRLEVKHLRAGDIVTLNDGDICVRAERSGTANYVYVLRAVKEHDEMLGLEKNQC